VSYFFSAGFRRGYAEVVEQKPDVMFPCAIALLQTAARVADRELRKVGEAEKDAFACGFKNGFVAAANRVPLPESLT